MLKIDSRIGIYKYNRFYCFMKGILKCNWPFLLQVCGSEICDNCKYGHGFDSWGNARSFTTAAFASSVQITTQEEQSHLSFIIKSFNLTDPWKNLWDTPRDLQTTLWESLLQEDFMDFHHCLETTKITNFQILDCLWHKIKFRCS